MKHIAVHLANGFEEIEAIGIIDVLRRAQFKVTSVSVTDSLEVKGSHGIVIKADKLFEDIDYKQVDVIVLPGGMPGSENLGKHVGLQKQILAFNEQGKPLGAICAAPMVLGKLGILAGKKATCYPGFEKYLEGALHSPSRTMQSDNIITGKGAGAAIEFALKIVEFLLDKKTADELAVKMIVQ